MSIFGQVWLWSLLAFIVGAVLAWLVLARPARKRVRELETELASAHADTARAAASTPARTAVLPPAEDWTKDRREHAPTEVIQATSAFEPEAEYDAEYRTAPESESVATSDSHSSEDDVDEAFAQAEAREHQAANGLFDSAPVESAPEDSGSAYRAAATEYLQPVDRDTGSHRIAEPAEDHDSGYHRVAEPADEHDSGYHRVVEPVDEHDSGYHRVPEPADVPETDRPAVAEEPSRHLAEPADGLSSLERRLDPTPLDSTAPEPEPVSLFRPGPGRAAEPEPHWFSQPDTPQRSPFEEPAEPAESAVGHFEEESTTDHLVPNVEPAAVSTESTEDTAEGGQGLPKRQRRESPRGGFDAPRPIQPSMRPVERREPDLAGGHSGSLFEPSVQPNQAAAPEPPPARQTADDAVPPGPFGPGSAMPRPGGGRPAEGFTVKASVTALRYCGEDSPQFPKMVAEVWFRSAADAERVGFRPLH